MAFEYAHEQLKSLIKGLQESQLGGLQILETLPRFECLNVQSRLRGKLKAYNLEHGSSSCFGFESNGEAKTLIGKHSKRSVPQDASNAKDCMGTATRLLDTKAADQLMGTTDC
jgi:hypothetical protein